jgi:WD40 repeat protein
VEVRDRWGQFGVPQPDPRQRTLLGFSPDGGQLAVAERDAVGLWDAARGVRLRKLPAGSAFPLAWRPDGKQIAFVTGGAGLTVPVHVVDATTGAAIRTLRPQGNGTRSLLWSPAQPWRLISGDQSRRVAVWEPESGTELLSFDGTCERLGWSRDGRRLLGSGTDPQAWESGGHDLGGPPQQGDKGTR